ncbi:leucyl aminopeptidase family protein [Phytohabitans flavus]|uniref:leucyl aminopeptidase family protein n=1 Tax=Phytohabitans flavus TaxID=1076124 RepID=UPI001E4EF574|nr:leucyl aminopeptidase family protein [Phytohabitans flavus]
MMAIRVAAVPGAAPAVALPALVQEGGVGLPPTAYDLPEDARAEAMELLGDLDAEAGATCVLRRPLRTPGRLLLVHAGSGDEAGWRVAGAAVSRAFEDESSITVAMPADVSPAAVRGLAEGLSLAAYRFSMRDESAAEREVTVVVDDPARYAEALATALATADATRLARDLTNTPSSLKNPAWFVDQVVAAVDGRPGLSVTVREPEQLAAEGFGGILAVGGGSASPPRLVELSWRPERARTHVVLVGKGITFDTGGISIKPVDGMKLMRKDMGGAASIVAATLGAAALDLPVRVTALAPLAENLLSGSAFRPGDVVRHYGGLTSETTNSDAEGRLVVADALAYAVERLSPDLLVDLATLTGANAVALGKRTAALYSDSDELAADLIGAAAEAGEQAWRMPLAADYVEYLGSDVADLYSAPDRGAGSVTAALFLREFVGDRRERWVHVDMSAPSWADSADGVLSKGATGWGVRTLLRWLAALPAAPEDEKVGSGVLDGGE